MGVRGWEIEEGTERGRRKQESQRVGGTDKGSEEGEMVS